MIRTFIIITYSFLLISCSGLNKQKPLTLPSENVFFDESKIFIESDLLETSISDSPFQKALTHCYKKKLTKGLKILQQGFIHYSHRPLYWNTLGSCYLLNQYSNKALSFYEKSLLLSKDKMATSMVSTYNNMSIIHFTLGNYQQALSLVDKAHKIAPHSKVVLYNKATYHLHFNQLKKSESLFKQIQSQVQKRDDFLDFNLAKIKLLSGEIKLAGALFKKIPHYRYKKGEWSYLYSLCLYKQGKFTEALKVLKVGKRKAEMRKVAKLLEKKIEIKIEEQNAKEKI
jgi:tetratricopeptide (TPR) repeat protein